MKLEIARESEIEGESLDYDTIKSEVVLNKIGQLKENYRVALTLHLIEGFDYEEISEIMQITYQNSRTTISRAKDKLRTILSQELINA